MCYKAVVMAQHRQKDRVVGFSIGVRCHRPLVMQEFSIRTAR